jgi:hypothetical protein
MTDTWEESHCGRTFDDHETLLSHQDGCDICCQELGRTTSTGSVNQPNPNATIPAALILRFDLDAEGAAAQQILRTVQAVLPPLADAWIGINEYAAQVDALLVTFNQGSRPERVGEER